MNRPPNIWLPVIYGLNALVAFLWLFLYGRRYSFRLAGVHFTSGILALAGMLIADILAFLVLRKKSK